MAPRLIKTPHEILQEKISSICHELLGNTDSFINVSINNVVLKENISEAMTEISFMISLGEEQIEITGKGSGIVDALYTNIVHHLNKKYCSFENIHLIDFAIEADFDKPTIKKSKTDAKVHAMLLIQGGADSRFVFRAESHSMISASILAVVNVVEYFINSEETVAVLHSLIQDSKKRNRMDLADNYLSMLAELVKNVSYENKIKILSEVHMNCEAKE